MPMVFPISPTVGQVFTSGGRSWVWNGSTWDSPARDNPTIQGIIRTFANTAERTAAIPSPTEGMTTYQLDTNFIDTYSGTAWVPTVSNNAWTSYTPTLSAVAGTLTSASASGRFKLVGKVCHVTIRVQITNNGTAAGALRATLPFQMTGNSPVSSFRENAVTGNFGQVFVSGDFAIFFSSGNSYPGGNGYDMHTGFTYEVA
jgi:hypothetical protein